MTKGRNLLRVYLVKQHPGMLPGTTESGGAVTMSGLLRLDFRLPAEVKKEGDSFISWCPLLDVFSQGSTRQEALSNLKEAIRLFIESCFERGTLEQILRESGFEKSSDDEEELSDKAQEYINVPLALIAKQHAEAHAN